MTKWEYLRVKIYYSIPGEGIKKVSCNGKIIFDSSNKQEDKFFLYKYLNELGEDGWELIDVCTFESGYLENQYYKRVIQA